MCFSVSSKLSEVQIKQLQKDFKVSYQESVSPQFFVVSGFSFPALPVLDSLGNFKNYYWGFIPHWVKDWNKALQLRQQCLNSISEQAIIKPSFRDALIHRQFCVLPINGFYEWQDFARQKYPYFIYPKSADLFYLAGIYNVWQNKALEEFIPTFTLLTVSANVLMAKIHNTKKRMPVILSKEHALHWLDHNFSFEQKQDLLVPCADNLLGQHTISKLITSRKENSNTPQVMLPYEYPELLLLE